jgi:hypothetical protein
VTTQLRLVETPEPRPRPARGKAARTTSTAPARARTARRARTGRVTTGRAASWGEWRLDAGTRQVGRAGVAQARRALEAVLEQQLSQAS